MRCGIIVVVMMLVPTGCGPDPKPDPAPDPVAAVASEDLLPLDGLDPAVRVALETAHRAWEADPQDAEAAGRIGQLLHAHDFDTLAGTWYDRAAAAAPDETRWIYYRAMVDASRGALDAAAEGFTAYLADHAGDAAARLRLADVNRRRRRWDDAAALYDALIDEGRNLAHARCGAGQVALALDRPDEAIEHLRAAVAIAPEYREAVYALGLACRAAGNTDAARAALARASGLDPLEPARDDPLAQRLEALGGGRIADLHAGIDALAAAKRSAEDGDAIAARAALDDAIEHLRRAASVAPPLAEAEAQLGAALLLSGSADEAEEHLRRAVAIEPDYADAWYHLGLLARGAGDRPGASAAFGRAVEIRPHHFDAQLGLGIIHRGAGRVDDAIGHLQAAMDIRPGDPRPYRHASSMLTGAGRFAEAAEILERGHRAVPGDLALMQRLAWWRATAPDAADRQPPRALELAERAARGSDHPRAGDTLAAALAANGRFEEAVRVAEAARSAAETRDRDLAEAIAARIDLYRTGRPYRGPAEGAAPPAGG